MSSTQLTAAITAADVQAAGSATLTVVNPAPGGGTSSGLTFTINAPNPVPTLTSLSPSSTPSGSAGFNLTVTGTGFVAGSQVEWNGSNRNTQYVSSTQLTASITAADVQTPGSAMVTVVNPTPGGGTSNGLTFTITSTNPLPALTSLNPSSAPAGSPGFNLIINGTGFVSSSQAQWNRSNRSTTFVSGTQLTAAITAADVQTAGSATVTVVNSPPGGGTSNPLTFTITLASATITSIFPTSIGANTPGFQLAVSGTGFTSSSTVLFNGSQLPTTFVSSTQLTAIVPASDLTTVQVAGITVSAATGSQNLSILGPISIVQDSLTISGLGTRPIRIAFAPDGALLVADQSGMIQRVVISNGTGSAQPWASFSVTHTAYLGLLGMALDPVNPPTASGGNIYIFYTAPAGDNRIAQVTFQGTPTDLVLGLPVAQPGDLPYLNGGKIAVYSVSGTPYLYASTGGSDLNPQFSQNPSDLHGKILRYTTTGAILSTNRTFGGASPVAAFACGFRNSFGFDFHPTTGALYASDNGNENPSAPFPWYDSLDRVLAGDAEGYGFTGFSQCQPNVTNPMWQNQAGLQIARAPTGTIFYSDQLTPPPRGELIPQLENSILKVGYNNNGVYQFLVDEYGSTPGQLLSQPSSIATLPITVAPADIQQGPDGCIYVDTFDFSSPPLYIYRFKALGSSGQ